VARGARRARHRRTRPRISVGAGSPRRQRPADINDVAHVATYSAAKRLFEASVPAVALGGEPVPRSSYLTFTRYLDRRRRS
jgi:hypothetical protein